MKIKRFILLMTLGFLIILFGLAPKARAAIVGGTVDTTGTVTGITGATYYNVSNWQDMIDTYKGVTPNAASSNTVFLNVTANVPGNSILNSGNTVSSGKSLSINGNNYTLYLDNDTNYTTAQSIGGSDGTARAFGSNGTISTDTTLTVKNATIVNNITSGIFQMKGLNAKATAVYENVTVSNGDAIYGAQPIRNDNGKVLFRGTNTFNILQNHNINDTSSAGADNQGEWIQGGAYLEVVTGTTTLNQSWGNDQPFYVYYSSGGSTLQVDAGAAMVWNLNKTYTMYYDDGSLLTVGALNWNINGSFVINGTVNTSSTYAGGWFMALNTLNSWNLNVGQNATLKVTTGGVISLDAFLTGAVKWNFAQGSSVLFNNLNPNQNVVSLAPGLGSSITMTDPKVVTFNTAGGSVFSTTVLTFPITISGSGLRTHSSSTGYTFDSTYDLITPNKGTITPTSSDIWYRMNTGTLTTFNPTLQVTNLSPNSYGSDASSIAAGKYISWYQPLGFQLNATLSSMNRTFNVSLDPTLTQGTPVDGSWSSLINGASTETLVVGDDRAQNPNIHVLVKMTQNNFPNGLQYYWVDPTTKTASQLSLNSALQIASITSDSTLPSWIKMTGAGSWYTMTFPTDSGLNIKANNSLLTQTNTNAGTFQYTVANGPS
ncbi:MAG: RTX toxin [Lactococcus lactis]|nr:Flagellar hook-length control protein FliK [Lactococcus lactis subsp. lactis]